MRQEECVQVYAAQRVKINKLNTQAVNWIQRDVFSIPHLSYVKGASNHFWSWHL